MKKIVRLTESDLIRLVKRVIRESKDKKFNPKDVLGSRSYEDIVERTFHPNQKDKNDKFERRHSLGNNFDIENESWNSNNGIIIFKYDDEVYVAPDCSNDMAVDYLKEHFGHRNERIGVPSYLADSDNWHSKDAFRDFTKPCR